MNQHLIFCFLYVSAFEIACMKKMGGPLVIVLCDAGANKTLVVHELIPPWRKELCTMLVAQAT